MFGLSRCSHKWNPSLNMVQTCSLCGMERIVSCSSHRWAKKTAFVVTNAYGINKGENWVMQCDRCGEVETIRVGNV